MPTVMADTIHDTVERIPRGFPRVAGYVTGTPDIKWTAADWQRFTHAGHVRIDQAPGLGVPLESDCADVEPGAKTVDAALAWLRARSARNWWSLIYAGNESILTDMRQAVHHAGLRKVQYWLSNPDLSEAEAEKRIDQVDGGIVAVQWATPRSNPGTLLPGTNETLEAANVDLSVTADHWFMAAR